jgi:hypothetical protein
MLMEKLTSIFVWILIYLYSMNPNQVNTLNIEQVWAYLTTKNRWVSIYKETMLICEILILYSKTSLSSFHTFLQAVVFYKILFTLIWSILKIISPPKIECYALSKSLKLYEKNNMILTLKINQCVLCTKQMTTFFIIQVHTENGTCKHSSFI